MGIAINGFFLRYGDPNFHLRYRIKLKDINFHSDILSILSEFLDQLVLDCFIKKWQSDTYIPEVFRYGGSSTISICEDIFYIDSKLCHSISNKFDEEHDVFVKHFVNATILLCRFDFSNYSIIQTQNLLTCWQEKYLKEIGISVGYEIRRKINFELKKRRLTPFFLLDDTLQKKIKDFTFYNRKFIKEINCEVANNTTIPLQEILESIFHMFCNKLYTDWSRSCEYHSIYLANRLLNLRNHDSSFIKRPEYNIFYN